MIVTFGRMREASTIRARKPRVPRYCSCGARMQGLASPITDKGKTLLTHRCSRANEKDCVGGKR